MALRIQNKHDSAADWTSANPTLLDGEIGFESDTKKFKIGDGATAWTALAYAGGSGSSVREIINTLLGVHTTLDHSAGAYQLLCDAVWDAMESNAGADAAANINATYTAADDNWKPTPDTAIISQTTATSYRVVGDIGGVETRYAQTFAPANAAYCSRVDIYIAARTGTPTGDITARLETTSGGLPTGTLVCTGAAATVTPTIGGWSVFDFNASLQFGVPLESGVTYALVLTCENQSNDQYWRWGSVTPSGYANGQACVSTDGGSSWSADSSYDMAFKIYNGGNMRLQSVAFTAKAQPTAAHIVILYSDATGGVLNSDIVTKVSRDGGTTWTTVTLVDRGAYGTYTILYAPAAISGQPAGTSVKWRIDTAGEHIIVIRGVGLVWE